MRKQFKFSPIQSVRQRQLQKLIEDSIKEGAKECGMDVTEYKKELKQSYKEFFGEEYRG
jgi:hypothetical protein